MIHDPDTIHVVRAVLGVLSFGIATIIATAISLTKGSPMLGRLLLVMFSFSITSGQVARWNEPLRWNSIITGVTLLVSIWYVVRMLREIRDVKRVARDQHV